MATSLAPESIVSLRCGVRPLAVGRSFSGTYNSLDLSRRHRIHRDAELPWISIYGGKLTDCVSTARAVVELLKGSTSPGCSPGSAEGVDPLAHRVDSFPGLDEPVHAASWCAQRESCWTLEDYLRRRTNISQWVARGGLGRHDEHVPHLVRLAQTFHNGDQATARMAVEAYQRKIRSTFDQTIADS
jgi:glycerol-3-phosphate dehydrogenase